MLLLQTSKEAKDFWCSRAESWLDKKASVWVAGHLKRCREKFEGYLFPALGNKFVESITMQDVDSIIRPFIRDEPRSNGTLLHLIEGSKMRQTKATSVAARLAPYVVLRAPELCGAQW